CLCLANRFSLPVAYSIISESSSTSLFFFSYATASTEIYTLSLHDALPISEWFDELRTGDEPNPLQWLNMAPPGHQPPPKNVLLELRKANRAQLLEAGVLARNIFVSGLCTACRRDFFFSYRKEGSTGRLLSVIGIKSNFSLSNRG